MSEEERIKISVNEEDVQNIINCYEKDIKYIEQLQQENKQLKEVIEEIREYIDKLVLFKDEEGNMYFRDFFPEPYKELLQILDKGVKND